MQVQGIRIRTFWKLEFVPRYGYNIVDFFLNLVNFFPSEKVFAIWISFGSVFSMIIPHLAAS